MQFFRVLQRFGLRLVVQRPSSHADMMLEYAGNACDCEECQDSSAPTTGELLDARRFFVTLKLASSDQKAQRDAQTSSLEPIEDSMDDRNCYAPADCFEISPARLSDGQLRRYRCAVELLRLKTPVVPVDVRPLSGKAPQAGTSERVCWRADVCQTPKPRPSLASVKSRAESRPRPRSSYFTTCGSETNASILTGSGLSEHVLSGVGARRRPRAHSSSSSFCADRMGLDAGRSPSL